TSRYLTRLAHQIRVANDSPAAVAALLKDGERIARAVRRLARRRRHRDFDAVAQPSPVAKDTYLLDLVRALEPGARHGFARRLELCLAERLTARRHEDDILDHEIENYLDVAHLTG